MEESTQAQPQTKSSFAGPELKFEDFQRYASEGGKGRTPLHQQGQAEQQTSGPVNPFGPKKTATNPLFNIGGPGVQNGGGIPETDTGLEGQPTPPNVNQAAATAKVMWLLMDNVQANVCMVIAQDATAKPYKLGKENEKEWIEAAIPWIETSNINLPPWVPVVVLSAAMISASVGMAIKERNRKKKAMEGNSTGKGTEDDGPGTISDAEVISPNPEDELARAERLREKLLEVQHQARMKGMSEAIIFKNWDRPPFGKCWYHWYFRGEQVPAAPGKKFAQPEGAVKTFSNTWNQLIGTYRKQGVDWLPDFD